DRDDAAVVAPADQPAEALLERDRGGGQLDRRERVLPGLGSGAHPRRDQRVGVRRERQLVDHDERQRIARDVDALPERAGAEQHGAGRRAKPRDQGGARRVALDEAGERQIGEPHGGLAQRAVAGEQQERAAARDREELGGARGGGGGEAFARRRQI